MYNKGCRVRETIEKLNVFVWGNITKMKKGEGNGLYIILSQTVF